MGLGQRRDNAPDGFIGRWVLQQERAEASCSDRLDHGDDRSTIRSGEGNKYTVIVCRVPALLSAVGRGLFRRPGVEERWRSRLSVQVHARGGDEGQTSRRKNERATTDDGVVVLFAMAIATQFIVDANRDDCGLG
jgi:hypothetical protein